MSDASGPVLAHCKTGTRSATLYGPALPGIASSGSPAPVPSRAARAHRGTRLARRCASPVRHGEAHLRHTRRTLSCRPRHNAGRARAHPALPSRLLLPRSRDWRDADPASADRGRHRLRRSHHRFATHLARSRRQRQGAYRLSPPLARMHLRQWQLARPRSRHACPGHGRWRGLRDHGLAPDGDAGAAGGRGHVGQPPRRPDLPARLPPPLHRGRCRRRGRHGIERLSQRAGEVGILALALRPQLGDSTTIFAISVPPISRHGCAISSSRRMTVSSCRPDEQAGPAGGQGRRHRKVCRPGGGPPERPRPRPAREATPAPLLSRPHRGRRPPLPSGLRGGRARGAAGERCQAAMGAATPDGDTP